jgi:hypothetical protein
VCSLERAKRLKELRVKQESFWAWYETTDRDDTPRLNCFDEYCTVCTLLKQAREEEYSAFTVAELGEMLRKADGIIGLDHGVGHFWPLSIT